MCTEREFYILTSTADELKEFFLTCARLCDCSDCPTDGWFTIVRATDGISSLYLGANLRFSKQSLSKLFSDRTPKEKP